MLCVTKILKNKTLPWYSPGQGFCVSTVVLSDYVIGLEPDEIFQLRNRYYFKHLRKRFGFAVLSYLG